MIHFTANVFILGAFISSSVAAAPTPAQVSTEGPTAGLAPLVWEGDPHPGAEAELRSTFRSAMSGDGIRWIEPEPLREAIAARDGCNSPECLAQAGKAASTDYVVVGSVSFRDRVYQIAVEIVDVETGTVAAQTSEFCEICSVKEAAELTAEQVAAVRPTLEALMRGEPTLEVSSAPPGAIVLVDGKRVGVTPLTLDVDPGRHVVRLEMDGRLAAEREIMSVEGARERVAIELAVLSDSASQDVADTAKPGRGLIGGGVASLVVGLAAAGAGVPLLMLDGQQNTRRCTGNDVDVNGTCRFSYETLAGGATLVAVGGGRGRDRCGARRSGCQASPRGRW